MSEEETLKRSTPTSSSISMSGKLNGVEVKITFLSIHLFLSFLYSAKPRLSSFEKVSY